MKTLYFATGNKSKLKHAQENLIGYNIENIKLDLVEPQSLDQVYVANYKVEEAFKQIKKPVFCEDVGLYIEKFNNFPGIITKYVLEGIGIENILKIINDDEPAYYQTTFAYKDSINQFHSTTIMKGRLTKTKISKNFNNHTPFQSIFIPEGYDVPLIDLTDNELNKLEEQEQTYTTFIKKLKQHGI